MRQCDVLHFGTPCDTKRAALMQPPDRRSLGVYFLVLALWYCCNPLSCATVHIITFVRFALQVFVVMSCVQVVCLFVGVDQ